MLETQQNHGSLKGDCLYSMIQGPKTRRDSYTYVLEGDLDKKINVHFGCRLLCAMISYVGYIDIK